MSKSTSVYLLRGGGIVILLAGLLMLPSLEGMFITFGGIMATAMSFYITNTKICPYCQMNIPKAANKCGRCGSAQPRVNNAA